MQALCCEGTPDIDIWMYDGVNYVIGLTKTMRFLHPKEDGMNIYNKIKAYVEKHECLKPVQTVDDGVTDDRFAYKMSVGKGTPNIVITYSGADFIRKNPSEFMDEGRMEEFKEFVDAWKEDAWTLNKISHHKRQRQTKSEPTDTVGQFVECMKYMTDKCHEERERDRKEREKLTAAITHTNALLAQFLTREPKN